MTPIEKQILKNQQAIMNTINHIMVRTCVEDSGDFQRQLIKNYEKTRELLNPTKKEEEPSCDMKETKSSIMLKAGIKFAKGKKGVKE